MEKSLNKNDLALSFVESGLAEKVLCTDDDLERFAAFGYEQSKLPNDVYVCEENGEIEYFRLNPINLEDGTLQKYLISQQLNQAKTVSDISNSLDTIKSCIIFFTIVMIISLIATLFVSCSVVG